MKDNYIERVAAYIRVSTEEQKMHGLSLDAQVLKLEEFAQKHNLKIVEWYRDEGVSGRKLIRRRPELQRMLKDAQKGLFDRIIFIKLDRFFRSVAEYHECMKTIDPVVWTATEEKYDLTTANGRAFVNMKLTIAELEADQTGERIKIINDYKVRNGQALQGTHCMPPGYKVEKCSDGIKRVIKDENEAAMVEDIFNHYLIYQSMRETTHYISQKYDYSIMYETINRMLQNTMYYGTYRDNSDYCEPYITRETFERIQEIKNKNIKYSSTSKRIYLFSGLCICPECGCRLKGTVNTTIRNRNGQRFTYKYQMYCCGNYRIQKGTRCSYSKAPNQNTIEKALFTNLENFFEEYRQKMQSVNSADQKRSAAGVSKIRAEIERLNYSWQKNRISVEDYDKKYEELSAKLQKLQSDSKPGINLSHVEDILKSDWRSMYKELDDENKRAFWRSFISELHFKGSFVSEIIFY